MTGKFIERQSVATHPHKAAAHVGVSDREAGFGNGFFEDEVDDSFESLLSVYAQLGNLLHELLEHLRRQFVQDAAHSPEQILGLHHFRVVLVATILLHPRLPGFLSFVQLHVVAQRHAGDDLAWLFTLTLLRTTRPWKLGDQKRKIRKRSTVLYHCTK